MVIGGGVNGLTCAASWRRRASNRCSSSARRLAAARANGRDRARLSRAARAPRRAAARGVVGRSRNSTAHGLEFRREPRQAARRLAPTAPLHVCEDAGKDRRRLARGLGARCRGAGRRFVGSPPHSAGVIGIALRDHAAVVDDLGGRDLWALLRTLRAFRRSTRADAYRLLRWGPMAVADLVGECFETEPLRAAVAADGIFGTRLGPWSAGSGMVLLLRAANESLGSPAALVVRGRAGGDRPGARARRRRAGGDIRTGAAVSQRPGRRTNARAASSSTTGTELEARAVVSGVDPKQTFLRAVRSDRSGARVFVADAQLPLVAAGEAQSRAVGASVVHRASTESVLAARVRIAPDVDYLERAFDHAKYGACSPEPYIEFTIPSLLDPLARAEGRARPLRLRAVGAEYRREPRDGNWDRMAERPA